MGRTNSPRSRRTWRGKRWCSGGFHSSPIRPEGRQSRVHYRVLLTIAPHQAGRMSCASTSVVKEESFLSRLMLNRIVPVAARRTRKHVRADVVVVHPENFVETPPGRCRRYESSSARPKNERLIKPCHSLDHRRLDLLNVAWPIVNHHRPQRTDQRIAGRHHPVDHNQAGAFRSQNGSDSVSQRHRMRAVGGAKVARVERRNLSTSAR